MARRHHWVPPAPGIRRSPRQRCRSPSLRWPNTPKAPDRATWPHADRRQGPVCHGNLIATHRSREILVANAVQGTVGEGSLGVGNQRHRTLSWPALATTLGHPHTTAARGRTTLRCRSATNGRTPPLRPDPSRDRGRYRRCGWCLQRIRPPSTADLGGQVTAVALIQCRERDVPELFGVDERAIHVEQHRVACRDSVSVPSASVKFMTILVTGATGNIGRLVVNHLIELGANDIRALTKNPAKANLPDGVTAVTGFLGDPDTLPAALEGVERMYLAPWPPTLDVTLDLAEEGGPGVRRRAVRWRALAGAHRHDRRVRASSTPSSGRASFSRTSPCGPSRSRRRRTVREPYPDVVEAPISMDDIARVAATLLVKPEQSHYDQMYELTGPEALTRRTDRRADRGRHRRRRHVRAVQPGRDRSRAAPDHGRRGQVVPRPDGRRRAAGRQRPRRRAHRDAGRIGGAVGGAQRFGADCFGCCSRSRSARSRLRNVIRCRASRYGPVRDAQSSGL